MAEGFLRSLLGVYCSVAGVVSVGALLFSGDRLFVALGTRSAMSVQTIFLALLFLGSLAVTGLFAQGISRARSGEVPRKLWVSCVLAGLPMILFVFSVVARRV